MKFDTAVRSL